MLPLGYLTEPLTRLLWQLGPFNAMYINLPFHSTPMSINKISGNFFVHLNDTEKAYVFCYMFKTWEYVILCDIQVENDRLNTGEMLRTGERIKTF